jgi:hypothetical protein
MLIYFSLLIYVGLNCLELVFLFAWLHGTLRNIRHSLATAIHPGTGLSQSPSFQGSHHGLVHACFRLTNPMF